MKLPLRLIILGLMISTFSSSLTLAEEVGIKYALAQYTFTNQIPSQTHEQLDPERGVLYANDNKENNGIEGVSFVAHRTSTKTFKSIEIGGSIGAAMKEPEATINVVATW